MINFFYKREYFINQEKIFFIDVVEKRNVESWIQKVILKRDVAMAVYLLDHGADPNLREIIVICSRIIACSQIIFVMLVLYTQTGRTALWAAARQNDYEMVKLLLDRGADLTLANAVKITEFSCTNKLLQRLTVSRDLLHLSTLLLQSTCFGSFVISMILPA